jgi:hypothetical protein
VIGSVLFGLLFLAACLAWYVVGVWVGRAFERRRAVRIRQETDARGLFPGDRVRLEVWIGGGVSGPADFRVRSIRKGSDGVAVVGAERCGRSLEGWEAVAGVRRG